MRALGSAAALVAALIFMALAFLICLWGSWAAVMLAALLFGMGYGPSGPIGMTLVTRRTPPGRRGLFLSLRQAAQPLAAAIGGRVLPPLMAVAGWQAGVYATSALLACGAIVVLLGRTAVPHRACRGAAAAATASCGVAFHLRRHRLSLGSKGAAVVVGGGPGVRDHADRDDDLLVPLSARGRRAVGDCRRHLRFEPADRGDGGATGARLGLRYDRTFAKRPRCNRARLRRNRCRFVVRFCRHAVLAADAACRSRQGLPVKPGTRSSRRR